MAQKISDPRRCLNPKCGIAFIPNSPHQKFCSEECRLSAYKNGYHFKKPLPASVEPIACEECGNLFYPHTKKHAYCSDHCRDTAYRKANYNTRPKPDEPKPKKIKPGTRAWKLASPYQRMNCMTLAEVQAESRNRGITYRIAQDMYYAQKLPDDFGKALKRTE